MIRASIALVLLITAQKILAGDEKGVEACNEVFQRKTWKSQCCDMGRDGARATDYETTLGCPQPAPGEEWTCAHAECPLKSLGYLKDGKIDFEAMKQSYEEMFSENPEAKKMFDEVQKECSDEKLESFSDEMCLAQKFEMCVAFMAMMSCSKGPKWKNDDETCQKIADNTKLCDEAIRKMKK